MQVHWLLSSGIMFLQQLRIEKFHTRVKRTRSLDRLAVEVSFIGDLLLFFRQQVSKHRPFYDFNLTTVQEPVYHG